MRLEIDAVRHIVTSGNTSEGSFDAVRTILHEVTYQTDRTLEK
jgi:hypothetical protein